MEDLSEQHGADAADAERESRRRDRLARAHEELDPACDQFNAIMDRMDLMP
jgi:hypothetical protein